MNPPTSETILNGLCIAIIGGLGFALIAHAVPTDSRELLAAIIGGLTGWMKSGGTHQLAEQINNRTTNPQP